MEDADILLVPSAEVTGRGMLLKFLTLGGGGWTAASVGKETESGICQPLDGPGQSECIALGSTGGSSPREFRNG